MIVQRFDCGQGPVVLSIEVFSPRSIASRFIGEQRRLTEVVGADDIRSIAISVPGSPLAHGALWRPMRQDPNRVAATSLWIDSRPGRAWAGGACASAAWHSIVGSRFSPVLVVVTPAYDKPDVSLAALEGGARSVADFLQSQPEIATLITRLSEPAQVKD